LGNLATPKSVQKLQRALHAKAKAEAGYRFYALYDKISREDILAHAYAQCRSNKGAPGVDGQEFADEPGAGDASGDPVGVETAPWFGLLRHRQPKAAATVMLRPTATAPHPDATSH
jgi:hypothetical protein